MRASIIIASFAALAASSPLNVPVAGDVHVPDVAKGITAKPLDVAGGVVKREITTLPLDVVSNLPIDSSKLPVDMSSLPADVVSLVDLSKLPVDVTGLPTDVLDLIGDLLNLLDVSKLPVNVANLPSDILEIVGDVTDILDLSKIPVDLSKLPVLSHVTDILTRDVVDDTVKPVVAEVKKVSPNTLPVKRDIPGVPALRTLSLTEAHKVDVEDVLHKVSDLLEDLLNGDALLTTDLAVNASASLDVSVLETIQLSASLRIVLNIVASILG